MSYQEINQTSNSSILNRIELEVKIILKISDGILSDDADLYIQLQKASL